MLAGRSPFKAPTPAAVVKAACKGVYDPLPETVSPACKDLLAGLLTVNPVGAGAGAAWVCCLGAWGVGCPPGACAA